MRNYSIHNFIVISNHNSEVVYIFLRYLMEINELVKTTNLF